MSLVSESTRHVVIKEARSRELLPKAEMETPPPPVVEHRGYLVTLEAPRYRQAFITCN